MYLSGRLSTRRCAAEGGGADVGFVEDWVMTSMAHVAKMSKAVERVTQRQKVVLAERKG